MRGGLRVQQHHRPTVSGRIHRPFWKTAAIGISGAREVRPVFLHRGAELPVLRRPGDSRLGIELAKYVFDFCRVISADAVYPLWTADTRMFARLCDSALTVRM